MTRIIIEWPKYYILRHIMNITLVIEYHGATFLRINFQIIQIKVKHFDITRSMEIIDFMKFNEKKKRTII